MHSVFIIVCPFAEHSHKINLGCNYGKKKGIDVSYWNGWLTEKQYKKIKKVI